MQFIFLQSILSFPVLLRPPLSTPWKFLQDHPNAKASFYTKLSSILRSLQLKSKPEGIQLSLYSLKHSQVQSLQEAEKPRQKQQHSLSLKCHCPATAVHLGLWHALMGCPVSWEYVPVGFSKTKERLHLLKVFILTGEQFIFSWSWWIDCNLEACAAVSHQKYFFNAPHPNTLSSPPDYM